MLRIAPMRRTGAVRTSPPIEQLERARATGVGLLLESLPTKGAPSLWGGKGQDTCEDAWPGLLLGRLSGERRDPHGQPADHHPGGHPRVVAARARGRTPSDRRRRRRDPRAAGGLRRRRWLRRPDLALTFRSPRAR